MNKDIFKIAVIVIIIVVFVFTITKCNSDLSDKQKLDKMSKPIQQNDFDRIQVK